MRIVADDKIPYLKGVLEPFAEVDYLPGDQISGAALRNTDALLTRSITKCNEQLLKNSTLKLIASATIGDDHIDKKFCAEKNIQWITAKGCNASAVEQYVLTSLLNIASLQNFQLKDKTIGIIGVGNIGSRVARVAELLKMNVLLNDPPRKRTEKDHKFVSIQKIQAAADIITIHVPLNMSGKDSTYHFCNEEFFEGLNKKIVFINTSRGEMVESKALKNAIKNGNVFKAVIDVWENEPVIDKVLLNLATIATPHIAGYSINGKASGTSMIVQEVSRQYELGLDDWYPDVEKNTEEINFNTSGLSDQELLYEIYNRIYPILDDDTTLRKNPENFERLRRSYSLRKENDAFRIKLKNLNIKQIQLLQKLKFQI